MEWVALRVTAALSCGKWVQATQAAGLIMTSVTKDLIQLNPSI